MREVTYHITTISVEIRTTSKNSKSCPCVEKNLVEIFEFSSDNERVIQASMLRKISHETFLQ